MPDKIGQNSRLGSGPVPSPLQHSNDDFYVMGTFRDDSDADYERTVLHNGGLHQCCDEPGDSD